jgi:hypothetical protein
MSSQTPIKDMISRLSHHRTVELSMNGFVIMTQLAPLGNVLSLRTVVYQGYDYIPPSVRLCLNSTFMGPISPLRVQLDLNEETFEIALAFSDPMRKITEEALLALLEEYTWLAEEWRRILDDHDKRDLVHVHPK